MNAHQILKNLDDHAADLTFPVLDNEYVEFAAARLSAFRSAEAWLLAFEVLGFSNREVAFVDDVYGYGSCVSKNGFVGEEFPLSSVEEQPVFDAETNDCIADWSSWSIKVHGATMSFSPTREEYAQAGIVIDRSPGSGSLSEIELMRFLIHRLGEESLFMSDRVLLGHFPECKNIAKVLQTTQWQHPDVAAGEQPSKNISIRSLVFALDRDDLSVFAPGRPNTDWAFWEKRRTSRQS